MNTMSLSSIFSMWFKPRLGVQRLQESSRSQLLIMVGLCLLYFVQVGLFVLAMDDYDIAPLLKVKGLVLVIYFLLFLAVGAFVLIQASTLAIWIASKCFNGQSTLFSTRAAVIWALIGSCPIGFFWISLYLMYSHEELLGNTAVVIGAASYIGALASVVYMFIVLLKTVSETNKFGLWRAFFTIATSAIILGGMAIALLPVFHLST
jgi:hypothetical protein